MPLNIEQVELQSCRTSIKKLIELGMNVMIKAGTPEP